MLRSLGIAYNEVVVALLDERGSYASLKRFAIFLSLATTGLLLLVVATPLAAYLFANISGLPPDLAQMAQRGLWLALPLPALSVMQSWYQGALLHGRRTRGITESVVVYLLTSAIILGSGVALGSTTGLYVGLFALAASVATQTAWLGLRCQPVLIKIKQVEFDPASR